MAAKDSTNVIDPLIGLKQIDRRRRLWPVYMCVVWASAPMPRVLAQGDAGADQPVTRREFQEFLEEYHRFKTQYARVRDENESLRVEVQVLKADLAELKTQESSPTIDTLLAEERAAVLEAVWEEFRWRMEPLSPGLTNFAIGGGAVVAFSDSERSDSSFGLGIAPLVLWKPTEKLLFEAEFGFSLTGDETAVELGLAQASYLLNDYVTLGAGLFRLPFAMFWERWHPSWINKLPTIPLLYERGLVGSSGLGVQVRGGAPIGSTKVNYALYYINGPDFRTSQVSAGRLGFDNFTDNNNNKGFGGRFGFLPIPELEVGYSFFTGRVGDSDSEFTKVDVFMHGVDLMYARDFDAIRGRLDIRAEAVWVDTDDAIFTGVLDPFTFDNKRSGWFFQAAYRPTKIDFRLVGDIELRDFEFILRYDQVRESGPGRLGIDRDRITFGVDYWLLPSAVLKAAYVFDDAHGDEDQDGVFFQFAVGF